MLEFDASMECIHARSIKCQANDDVNRSTCQLEEPRNVLSINDPLEHFLLSHALEHVLSSKYRNFLCCLNCCLLELYIFLKVETCRYSLGVHTVSERGLTAVNSVETINNLNSLYILCSRSFIHGGMLSYNQEMNDLSLLVSVK